MPSHPLPYREVVRKLKTIGVEEYMPTGGSSHRHFKREGHGPFDTIPFHGSNRPVSGRFIRQICRRFGIDLDAFYTA